MANGFDYSKLALKMVCPTNELITDDKDLPGVYVQRPVMTLKELLDTSDTTVHPAFMVGGNQISKLLIGKFQAKAHGNRIYSLPCEDPTANTNLDTFVQYARNKGAGHHEITAAEWALLALRAKKLGTKPKGNNNYGKDTSETSRVAIPTYMDGATVCRVGTGTGPVSWSDTGTVDGIFDLNGNVWEWIAGIRLVYGELQVIPQNNAALATTDMSATSGAWRAINANATNWDNLYITPNGSGTTSSSVKLDYTNSHWQWQAIALTSKEDSSRQAAFANTTIAAEVSTIAALYLRAMALAPEAGDTDYDGDAFYANNGAAERCAIRGGSWSNGALAGVFSLDFYLARSDVGTNLGGRPAFYES